jgi:DNA-binding XRE family transcriptional regulator
LGWRRFYQKCGTEACSANVSEIEARPRSRCCWRPGPTGTSGRGAISRGGVSPDDGTLTVPAFGDARRELREERDLSQEGAALRCGIDRAYFGQLERANKSPTMKTVWRIADGFDTLPSDLLARAERNLDKR